MTDTTLDMPLPQATHARAATGLPWFLAGFVLLCLVQFSNAWYWPTHTEFRSSSTPRYEKHFGVPFQYAMWLLIACTVGLHVARHGLDRVLVILKPWMLFWLVGVLAGVLGIQPVASLRHSIFWLVMALSAAVAGVEMTPRQALAAVLGSMIVLLAGSIVLALLAPGAGTQQYGSTSVWSGAYVSKNQLGWVAALACPIALHGLRDPRLRSLSTCVLLAALACMVFSQSKGAVVAAIAGLGYMALLAALSRSFSDGLAAMLAMGTGAGFVGLVKLVLPALLEMLGRDATLTGRTDIWDVYFSAMLQTPWLGQGPGAFTGLSAITEKLAAMLADLGGIYTPHNMFLGAFGDAGVFGLLAFCAVLLYLGVIDPIREGTPWSRAMAGLCVVTIVGGMVEAHEVYTMGVGGFILVICRAMLVGERAERPVAEDAP
ncbi:MAG: O-antigen ligase family protein [Vitreoscilla sp.]